jgi:broad specificity phosphatase PhoE
MPDVLILRHAQSTWNAEGRWQGQADPPLSARGECQARLAARRLTPEAPFDLVVSSDLNRAVQTAALMNSELGSGAPHEMESSLREYDVGAWSGHTRDEIDECWPGYLGRFSRGELDRPPGGESRADFDERVAEAGRRVAARARAIGSMRVLVVTHGGVVRSLARQAGQPETRTGHLAGYRGSIGAGGLFPCEPVDLLVGEDDVSSASL